MSDGAFVSSRPDYEKLRDRTRIAVRGSFLADVLGSLEIAAAQLSHVCPLCADLGVTCGACSTRVRVLARAEELVR